MGFPFRILPHISQAPSFHNKELKEVSVFSLLGFFYCYIVQLHWIAVVRLFINCKQVDLKRIKGIHVVECSLKAFCTIIWPYPVNTTTPLIRPNFLWPLLKRKSLPSRLNKSFRLFNLPLSASWIWIAKGDILLSLNVMVSFNGFDCFLTLGPACLVFFAGC